MYKKGLSMISMIIYVVLFFVFSAFAVTFGSNMNYQTLSQKGIVYINEQLQKLQYNMLFSAKNSVTVDEISGKIVFSNNDEYKYDSSAKKIYKNGGVLITDVESFNLVDVSTLTNTPSDFVNELDPKIAYVCIEVKLRKYGNEVSEKIFISAGDGLNV